MKSDFVRVLPFLKKFGARIESRDLLWRLAALLVCPPVSNWKLSTVIPVFKESL